MTKKFWSTTDSFLVAVKMSVEPGATKHLANKIFENDVFLSSSESFSGLNQLSWKQSPENTNNFHSQNSESPLYPYFFLVALKKRCVLKIVC